MKTNQKRLISIILVIVFIFMAIASGEGEPVDTAKDVPQSITQLTTGEKIPFSEEMLSDYNFSYEVSNNQRKIMLYVDTKG